MLRYKTESRPGLVALYDIRPGNGAGQFLQPWRPHGAWVAWKIHTLYNTGLNIMSFVGYWNSWFSPTWLKWGCRVGLSKAYAEYGSISIEICRSWMLDALRVSQSDCHSSNKKNRATSQIIHNVLTCKKPLKVARCMLGLLLCNALGHYFLKQARRFKSVVFNLLHFNFF